MVWLRAFCSVWELVIEFIQVVHVCKKLCTFHRICARFTEAVHVLHAPPNNVPVQLLWNGRLSLGALNQTTGYIYVCVIYIYICIYVCVYIYICVCVCFLYIIDVHIHTYMYIHPTVFENVCIPILRHFWCSPWPTSGVHKGWESNGYWDWDPDGTLM